MQSLSRVGRVSAYKSFRKHRISRSVFPVLEHSRWCRRGQAGAYRAWRTTAVAVDAWKLEATC